MNSRATAAKIINQVVSENRSLDYAFAATPLTHFKSEDQRFIHELCFGTLRWYHQLLAISNQLLHKPLAQKHADVLCVLLIGLYQLIHLKTPNYAAISSTVDAVKGLKKPWASGLVNKLLRLYLQTQTALDEWVSKDPALKYSHPVWLVKQIQTDWPEHWQAILNANNGQAPFVIRVNPQQTNITSYQAALQSVNIHAELIEGLPYALKLQEHVKVSELPEFKQGACYIQDQAGQYTGSLLQLQKGQNLLDACAAPGSKTTDILITEPELKQLVALDKSPERLAKIKENVDRLQLPHQNVRLILADATHTKTWWTGEPFDRILVDAPCSATGVIRRHPDIKLLRQQTDSKEQAKQQYALLYALWPLLKPNGLLLYSTCSILREENEHVIKTFLQQHADATTIPITIHSSIPLTFGCQLLPTINGGDGFYYALLQKKSGTDQS